MVLAGVFVTLATLLTSIDTAAFDKRFYRYQYQKLGTAQRIGILEEDLMRATDVLLEDVYKRQVLLSPDVEANAQNISFAGYELGQSVKAHVADSAALSALMYKIPAGGSVTVAKADGTDIDATAYALSLIHI